MLAKDYQQQALVRFNLYLDELEKFRASYDRLAELKAQYPMLDLDLPDCTAKAWERRREPRGVRRGRGYSPRQDGTGRPVPNITLTGPTGGRKPYPAGPCSATLATRDVL